MKKTYDITGSIVGVRLHRYDERYKELYRVADGDPESIRYFTGLPIEEFFDYIAAYRRDYERKVEEAKGKY